MIAALIYLQFHSVKNRLLTRIKRLRQPKYLFGAIVGGAYFYWYIFGNLLRARRSGVTPMAAIFPPEMAMLFESFGAIVLLLIVLSSWIFPHQRAALAFSEAEVAFLFPAPVSRRMLINYKLLRSQFAIFFSALLMSVLASRSGGGMFLIRVIGWWVVLSTLNLHFLSSSFARTLLLDRGVSNWKRRLGILFIAAIAVGAIFFWVKKNFPPLTPADWKDVEHLTAYAKQILESGPALYLLFPFRIVLGPFFSKNWADFLVALAPALLLMALHYWWIVKANVAFEEASVEHSRKLAERISAIRSNNWQAISKPKKVKRAPFALRAEGHPFVALLWKNLISAGQFISFRLWFILLVVSLGPCIALVGIAHRSGLIMAIGFFALMIATMSLFIGPQITRNDLRQDLLTVDVLKMYPMRGWQIVFGELLAPTAILAGLQWLCILLALVCISPPPKLAADFSLLTRLSFAFGAMVLFPMIDFVLLLIPNAAVLIFPAWFHTKEAPQGIEATGQRLILILGQLLFFVVAMIPAGLVCVGVFALFFWLSGMTLAVPLAAMAAAATLAAEAAFAIRELGKVFERFDLSAELAA